MKGLRYAFVAVVVTAGLFGLASAASAAKPASSSWRGESLAASSVSCTSLADVTTCNQAGVFAVANRERLSGGGPSRSTFVCVSRSTYSYITATGEPVGEPVIESGCATAEQAALTIAGKLAAGSLAPVDVVLYKCSLPDGCVASETVTVAGAWTATGPGNRYSSRQTGEYGACRERWTSSGESRPATASVTLDGVSLAEPVFAVISSGSFRSSSTCST